MGGGYPQSIAFLAFWRVTNSSLGNDAVIQGSSSDKVESAPWVRTCITRVPAGNSKSQIVLPDMLTKWSNTPWSYRFMLVLQELSLGDLPSKQTSWDLAEPPNHWLQTRSWRKTGENAPLPMHFLFHLFKKKTSRKRTKTQNEVSWFHAWNHGEKNVLPCKYILGSKWSSRNCRNSWPQPSRRLHHPTSIPPMISIPTPHSSRPWCGGLINQRCYIQLHRKCSKREPSHSPPVLRCKREKKIWETGAVSAAGVYRCF